MANPPQPQAPGFVPISLIGNADPVTGSTTVDFEASLPDASEPELELHFYEVHSISSSTPITVTSAPVPVWSNGVATFSLVMDSSIFNQLSSGQTNFAVTAKAQGRNSYGQCVFAISL